MFKDLVEPKRQTKNSLKDKGFYQVCDSGGDPVSGLLLKKEQEDYRLFQDGYYVGKLSVSDAQKQNLSLVACQPSQLESFKR